ncbi:protein FAM228B isoform X1 [Aquila chrysaetos chrysaetos]|nr:protein FAM228B isoform X1 [Aquila chrysaetos chrysaetos]XP_040984833.1 protein FAM228B isoform X1 [Aquila chrysaetos chrysaetos]
MRGAWGGGRRHLPRGWASPCGRFPPPLGPPGASLEPTSPKMRSVNSSETPWLLRFTCPRPVREHTQQRPWQAAPDESQDVIASAQCILDRENYFVRELDRYLSHNDFLNLRKKEILYKKWLEDVSEPLLQKIEDKMDSQSSKEIQKRKEEQLSLYLNYCKKKGYVALEAYDPSEYDPFFLKTCTDCWKVSIPTLQDPLLKDIQRKFIETGIIKQCETGRPSSTRELNQLSKAELPLLPLSRQRMDAVEWLKIPHAYIASEVHQTKRQKVISRHKDVESR